MTPDVCSYETSNALWDLGIRIETYFAWTDNSNPKARNVIPRETAIQLQIRFIPAPTASEIGERLPSVISYGKDSLKHLSIWKDVKWMINYYRLDIFEHESLAEVMGLMLKWLEKNGYLEKK